MLAARPHPRPTRDTGSVQPLVSVVVPVYNGLPHLHACIDSILAQDYPNLQIVFSDGGSTDDSLTVLHAIDDPRVEVIHGGTGAGANWTDVTAAARGEFIKLVCQDDLIAPDAISHQVTDLQAHPTAVMAIAPRDIVDANGKLLYAARGTQGLQAGLVAGPVVIHAAYVQGTNVIGEPLAVLFRREALLHSLPWDDSNPLMLDVSMYEKVARLGDIVVRKTPVGAFRVSTSSWSTRLAKVQLEQYRRWQRAYEQHLPAMPSRATRAIAAANARKQALTRRAAYAVLRLRGSLQS